MMDTLGAEGFMRDFLTFGWYIFQIIVFIKLLGACNNIRRLTERYYYDIKDKEKPDDKFESKEDIDNWLEGK